MTTDKLKNAPHDFTYDSPVALGHPVPDKSIGDYIDHKKTIDELRAENKRLRQLLKEKESNE